MKFHNPFRLMVLPTAVAVLGAASMFAVRGEWPWPRFNNVPTTLPIVVSDPFRVVRDTLHSGETVSTLLARQGVTGFDVATLGGLLSFDPRRLRAGLEFSLHKDAISDEATRIELQPDANQRLRFIRTSGGSWQGESVPIRWVTDTIRVAGVIESSLTAAADQAISEATLDRDARIQFVNDLANVNAWSVDFSRDPQPGDPFVAVVERMVSEEGDVRFGRVLASDLTINGKRLTAFRYTPDGEKPGYYDVEGRALKREFLAAPLEFRHISSGISRARFHPVLKITRKHEGIDYAANTGTPVRAASNGVVVRAGRAGGYGNMVELRHRNGITTRYAHLNRIASGIVPGRSVMQGDQIGVVGMTGTATGPHLHYEFRVNGVPRDPRSMKFDAGAPLSRKDLPGFESSRKLLTDLLSQGTGEALATLTAD
ncbi:MAG TPA: M23 family metallopeptidase [Gemmatimonadales bacterium]|nr:M23 family metallopeptidase [Gemmatimonadales bacterium]